MDNKKLYIAYGSNMNKRQMKMRCPNAKPIGKAILENYKLEFRGVANVIESEGEKVPIAVWEITEECEKALDIYEGYPRLYRKEYVEIEINNKKETGMIYVMNYGKGAAPNRQYFNVIKQGYKDFEIRLLPLIKALNESLGKK